MGSSKNIKSSIKISAILHGDDDVSVADCPWIISVFTAGPENPTHRSVNVSQSILLRQLAFVTN